MFPEYFPQSRTSREHPQKISGKSILPFKEGSLFESIKYER